MAIRAPDTSLKLMQIFSQLGEGLRDIANPNLEQERQFRNFLLQNPQRASALLDRQRELEGEQANRLADARQDVQVPNVSAPFGMSREEGLGMLQSLAALTPGEEFQQDVSRELQDRDAAGAIAGQQVAEAEAATEEALFNQDFFDELRGQGVPRSEAAARAAVADFEVDDAEFKQDMTRFSQEVFDSDAFTPAERRRFAFAVRNPEFLRDIQHREELALSQRMEALDQAQGRQEFLDERLKLKFDLMKEINGQVSRINEIQTGEVDVGEDELKREVQTFNQMMSDYAGRFPNDAQAMYGDFVNNLTGAEVEFKSAPSFFGSLTDSPRLVKFGVGVLEKARDRMGNLSEDEVQRFKEMNEAQKEAFVNERFNKVRSDLMGTDLGRELAKNLSGEAQQLFLQDIKDTVRTSIVSGAGEARDLRRGPTGSLREAQAPPVDLSKSPVIDAVIEFFRVNPSRPGRPAPSGIPTGAAQ